VFRSILETQRLGDAHEQQHVRDDHRPGPGRPSLGSRS
jgi:hypothetical protein